MLRRNYWRAFLLFLPFCSGTSVNFTQCFVDVTSCASDGQNCPQNLTSSIALSILRTSGGESITPDQVNDTNAVTAISYQGCVKYCGRNQEPFVWSVFSQEYSAWLLPYLALLSQLPFGARRRTHNLMSAVLTLGSPTLAGYSLYMTLLNARWLNEKLFAGINYPNSDVRKSVVKALSNLQHVPLRVHPKPSGRFESLVVHPKYDQWWVTFANELDFSHTWSIASATSIMWVVIAYLLTVAYSLSDVANNINSSGQGTGSIWMWLLPVVAGWLILSPKCSYNRVHAAYDKAKKCVSEAHGTDATADPVHIDTGSDTDFGLTIEPSSDWKLSKKHISSPDELLVPSVFNYARTLLWCSNVYTVALYYRTAWRKSNNRQGVKGERIPEDVAQKNVPRENRIGSHEQIISYCTPDSGECPGARVLWPQGMLKNMVLASLISLALQWGTTAASLLIVLYTPTIGLGCRSLAYLLYGVFSTAVWILLVFSNLLGYYAHHLLNDTPNLNSKNRRHVESILRVADWLRWIGKLLAIINAIGIISNSVFQYAGVYDNCYCNSSVFSWREHAFNVINPNLNDISKTRSYWIGAFALSLVSSGFFVGIIYLMGDSLPHNGA